MRYLIFIFALAIGGCASLIAPPPGSEVQDLSSLEKSAAAGWKSVLQNSVDSRGRIDFKKVSMAPGGLHAFVRYIAQVSPGNRPELFPHLADKLAYHINAYNALAMYGVIQKKFPSGFSGLASRAGFFKFTEYLVGGERISLYDYENDVIRPLGDPRAHFALNCMASSCPRLPKEPFRAETLERQLTDAAHEFLNSPAHIQVDKDRNAVRLSEILKWYKKDFVNPAQASSLLSYVNRYRKEKIPESFKVDFIPYNWTVNKQ